MSILRSYAYLFTRYRGAYGIGLLALLVTNALYMAIPRIFGAAIDAFEAGAASSEVYVYAGAIILLSVLQAVFRILSRIYVLGVSRRVEYDLKGMLHDRLVRMAPSFYEAMSTGDLMSRMTNDVTLVRALGGPGVLYFANAVLIYILGVLFMVTLSWRLTLIVLAPLPVIAWLVRGMVHQVRAYALASREALSELNTVVQENLAGAQVVRSFGLENAQVARFEERSEAYVDWALKESWTRAQMIPLVGLAGGLSFVGVLGLGAPMVASGAVSVGDLVAFMSYIAMMVFPTVALGWILSLLQRGSAALERLDRVLGAPVTIASSDEPLCLSEPRGQLEVRDLTFAYDDAQIQYAEVHQREFDDESRRPALENVDLQVGAGEFVALVGRVGSGKSTLLKSIVRLVELPQDRILLDGIDITRIDLGTLREVIAYVPQDDFLFSATVSENIAFGRPDSTAEQILDAARAAGLDPGTSGLARGLDTQVGERGLNLSGGQRQRVALARALLRNAPVLVLDNALSNVDTETERAILIGLSEARRTRTVVASSNRITAIQEADRIVVMDRGRVIDSGTHAELVGRTGLYASMHEQQQLSAKLESL